MTQVNGALPPRMLQGCGCVLTVTVTKPNAENDNTLPHSLPHKEG
jgi:hypothetical protein